MSFKEAVFNITKEIKKNSIRNDIKKSLVDFRQTNNREMFENFEYVARNQRAQFGGFLAVDDNRHLLNSDNNPFKISALPTDVRKWMEIGHNDILHFNDACVATLGTKFEVCKFALDPYKRFKINFTKKPDLSGLIDNNLIVQASLAFKESKPVKRLLEKHPIGLEKLNPEQMFAAVNFLKNHLIAAGVNKTPDDIAQVIRDNRQTPENNYGKFLLDLVSALSMLEIANQLFYQAVIHETLLVLNEDNIIDVGAESGHFLGKGIEIECQMTSELFFDAVSSVVLVDFEIQNFKRHNFCSIESESISFSQEQGNSAKLKMRFLDDDLNPYFGIYSNSFDP